MSNDGTYIIVYAGDYQVGFGYVAIDGNRIEGGDWGGLHYEGTIEPTSDPEKLSVDLTMTVPADGVLVQGTAPQETAHSRQFVQEIPTKFAECDPFRMFIPPGNVWASIRRVPGDAEDVTPEVLRRFLGGIPGLMHAARQEPK